MGKKGLGLMAFIPFPNGTKIRFGGTWSEAQGFSFGFHMVGPTTASPTTLTSLATAAETWASENWQNIGNLETKITTISVADVSVTPPPQVVLEENISGAVGSSTSCLPSSTSAVMVESVASGALRHPGALRLPGVDSSFVTAPDTLNGTGNLAYHTAMVNLLSGMNAAVSGWQICVASYHLHAAPRPSAIGPLVTAITPRAKLGTVVDRLRAGHHKR